MEIRKNFGRVGVLMGGPSSEREISLKSGMAVFAALKSKGLDVVAIDIATDEIAGNKSLIDAQAIDCAFVALHGRFGEDGQIQDILESIGIPYTGSGVSASKLAMDKIASRRVFQGHQINVPRYKVLLKAQADDLKDVSLPAVVKPAAHGSSIGLSIVEHRQDLARAIDAAFGYDTEILIEEYIPGREVTIGILAEQALPVIEIIPKKKFFDYEAKYQAGMTEYIVPAKLDDSVTKDAQQIALKAHRALGCLGCSRVDIILKNNSLPYVLEINTIPGFTATSLLPKAAKTIGMEFTDLCLKLLQLAYEKT